MIKRIIFDAILFTGLFASAPWWIIMAFATVFCFYFKRYYEIIAVGILLDAIYGTPQFLFFNSSLIFSISSFLILYLTQVLKKKIIYY